jgi:deazaflavin-dependent oxidoreductase (nitroreductase family)
MTTVPPHSTRDERIRAALETDRTIDITTTGRKSGQPRRIEMAFHRLDGAIYLTGTPGTRDWYANLVAHPDFTFHLKRSATADLPARATPITDPAARRAILARILERDRPDRLGQLDTWVQQSPLVAVTFPADAGSRAESSSRRAPLQAQSGSSDPG